MAGSKTWNNKRFKDNFDDDNLGKVFMMERNKLWDSSGLGVNSKLLMKNFNMM